MESNFKQAAYLISNNQSNEYWKQFLENNKQNCTAIFYKYKNQPIMIQDEKEIPDYKVEWLEPLIIENGYATLVSIKERSMFDLEWIERNSQQ